MDRKLLVEMWELELAATVNEFEWWLLLELARLVEPVVKIEEPGL